MATSANNPDPLQATLRRIREDAALFISGFKIALRKFHSNRYIVNDIDRLTKFYVNGWLQGGGWR